MAIQLCMPVGTSCRATPIGSQKAAVPAVQVVQKLRAPGSLRSFLPCGLQNGLTASWVLALFTLHSAGFKPQFAGVQFCSGETPKAPSLGVESGRPFRFRFLTPFGAPVAASLSNSIVYRDMSKVRAACCLVSAWPAAGEAFGTASRVSIGSALLAGVPLDSDSSATYTERDRQAQCIRSSVSGRGHYPAKSHQGCSTRKGGILHMRSNHESLEKSTAQNILSANMELCHIGLFRLKPLNHLLAGATVLVASALSRLLTSL